MNTVSLQDPSFENLQKAYRKLQRFENLQLQCETSALNQTLEHLEKIGFIGLKVIWPLINNKAVEISCIKGKHGPCYDTGQSALYTGKALAVLDDDAHLLFQHREQAVCLKTANIYQSPTYAHFTQVSSPNTEKLERIQSEPILFDCDDYSDSVDHLLSLCPDSESNGSPQAVFYSGPFKAMISASGHLIRRGQWCNIPRSQAEQLKNEGFQFREQEANPAENLKQLISTGGKQALLEINFTQIEENQIQSFSASTFRGISEHLKEKLTYCIEQNQDYMMLVGSDPQDKLGCCPSEDVGMANQLMRSGILTKAKQETDENQCPIQLFAFQDELVQKDHGMEFKRNHALRQQVLKYLEPSKSQRIIRWVLFAFILISLLIAFKKISERYRKTEQKQIESLIQEYQLNKTSFVLFHHEVRCEMCLEMEKHTRAFAEEHQLEFLTLNMDLAHWKKVIDDHQLFSAALFCIQPDAKGSPKVTLIKDAWESWNKPLTYRKILQAHLP